MEQKTQTIAIVFVPLPMHSHLDQLLRFALLLSSHPSSSSLSLHYAAPPTQLKELRSRLDSTTNTIEFHELPIPTPLHNPTSTSTTSSNFPSHFEDIFEAFELARYPLSTLLRSLSEKHSRLVVVHDPLASFAASEAESLSNSEAFSFFCVPALFLLNYWHGDSTEELLKSNSVNVRLPKLNWPVPEKIAAFSKRHLEAKSSISSGVFVNTCRPLEGEIINLLAQEPKLENRKLFSVAPITFRGVNKDETTLLNRHESLQWLDKQPAESVVYISFGTTTMLDKGKIEQLSSALLRCAEQRFIWVLREADKYDALSNCGSSHYSMLPFNFEHDVKGRGMVITNWAPQVEILAHRSIGAFLSHCGWNSCMESLLNGVPIIAWPMAGDQPINAAIVADYMKAGVSVRDCASIDEIVTAENVEVAIKRMMVYDEGKEMRNRAKMLGESMRESASEGGASRTDLDAFVSHVTRESIVA